MKLGGIDYEETSRRHKTANLRQKRDQNQGRKDTTLPPHVRASLTIDIDEAVQGDSPATTDTI